MPPKLTMEQRLQYAINQNSTVQTYSHGRWGTYITTQKGKERLQNADGTLTPVGKKYFQMIDVPPPELYSYNQPLEQGRYVTRYNGTKMRVIKKKGTHTAEGSTT